ncbi:DNA binding domain-containing protein, excisionase family [Lachnospiraceae bacterium]|nr:DNA binding domain-containing protein, excisionase family [Lachnospiraceae bacterium]
MMESKFSMSIEEASEYTGIGRNTIRKLIEWKKLPVLRIGRKIVIRRDALEKFISINEGSNLRIRDETKAVTN